MKLEGYRRLEAHVPTDLWDEIEKARGQMTRSEFTRQALRAQLDYPSMLGSPVNGTKDMADLPTVTAALDARDAKLYQADTHAAAAKAATTTASDALKTPAVKTAREALLERTRLMRGNNSGSNS